MMKQSMIEYFGNHGCKQCIRGKPTGFGYKAWCLNTDSGYLLTFDLYQGCTYKGNSENEKTFGKCAATLLKNIDPLPEVRETCLIIITLIISSQPSHFSKNYKTIFGGTGTIRENRCKTCFWHQSQKRKKQKRGSSEYFVDTENKITVYRWMENPVVTIGSTVHTDTSDSSRKVKWYYQK